MIKKSESPLVSTTIKIWEMVLLKMRKSLSKFDIHVDRFLRKKDDDI
jgi:hypothetical protein